MAAGGHIVYKNVRVLTRHLMGYMMLNAEYGANRIIRLEVIRLFVNYQVTPEAIFDFRKCTFGAKQCLGSDEWKLGLKFGENHPPDRFSQRCSVTAGDVGMRFRDFS